MSVKIMIGDCREILQTLPDESVHCCVTSPPYFGLRDYGHAGQIGLESTPDAFVAEMVAVFREVRRVLRDDGTLWLNLGDSYSSGGRTNQVAPTLRTAGHDAASGKQAYLNNFAVRPGNIAGLKPKDLIGIPWRVAFALQADGWYLRQDIIWSKPNPMPESVTDRCTKAHEYIFLMSKSARYYYDAGAIAEAVTASTIERLSQPNLEYQIGSERVPGKTNGNMKAVGRGKAGCPEDGTVLDPFGGAGTTGLVADRLKRSAILIELNPEYAAMAERRIYDDCPLFVEAAE